MKKSEVVKMAARITAGILSNPACGMSSAMNDGWMRQQLIRQVIQETVNACIEAGISIEDDV